MRGLVIGVTSHRNLSPEESEGLRVAIRHFLRRPELVVVDGKRCLLSPLAAGGDQLAATEALDAGIRVVAPLPLPLDLYVDDFEEGTSKDEFRSLCERVEFVHLPTDYPGTEGVDPQASRNAHYAQAGAYVAEHCHILLAIWDGKQTGREGGTAEVVAHCLGHAAANLTGPGQALDESSSLDVTERLVFHIVCSRDEPDGAPATSLEPLQTYWRTGELTLPGSEPMPEPFRSQFARLAELEADASTHCAWIDSASVGAAVPGDTTPVPPRSAPSMFNAADCLAVFFQRRVVFALRVIYTLAALMGVSLVLYADFSKQDHMIFVFLALFAVGAFVDSAARRGGWHRKHLNYRALAEALRIRDWWRRAGLKESADIEDPSERIDDVDLGWIRQAIRSADLEAELSQSLRTGESLADVIEDWIGRPGVSGQLNYYERCIARRSQGHRLTERIGIVSLWFGIGISVFLALSVSRLGEDSKKLLVAAMATLSIVGAVREAYAYRKADKELVSQYRWMHGIYLRARNALDRATTPEAQRRILRSLATTATAEHVRWAAMHRDRPIERPRM